jgi:hypothetical protein
MAPGEIAAVPTKPTTKRAAKNGKAFWRCPHLGANVQRAAPNVQRRIPS